MVVGVVAALSSISRAFSLHRCPRHVRGLSLSAPRHEHGEYNEDQKTTVTLLNRETSDLICVEGISEAGFELSSGLAVVGPMAVFPRTVLGWLVSTPEDIVPASLALFSILEPRLDCLVIGTGNPGTTVSKDVITFLRQKKIGFEILPTEQAVATFNFMNLERRCVAAALLPPQTVNILDHLERDRRLAEQRREMIEAA